MTNLELLRKERDSLFERIAYLKYKIKHFSELEHRSECPCCESKINFELQFKPRLESLKEELMQLDQQVDNLTIQIKPLETQERELQQKIKKEFDKQVQEFYNKNKPLFNKTTKQAHNNLPITLPSNLSQEEKSLWNRAMDFYHLDRPSMEDLEDLEDLFFQL